MRHHNPLHTFRVIIGAIIILGLLTACGAEPEGALDLDELLDSGNVPAEQPVATEVAEVVPTEVPRATTVPVRDENCIDCHTDAAILMDLATEAEPEEAHSSGEG